MKRLLLFLLMLMFCLPVCAEQQTTILGHMPDDEYIHQYVAPNGQLLWFTAIEKNPYIKMEDVNFDGTEDIVVFTVRGASNFFVEFFLYDAQADMYTLAPHPGDELGICNYGLHPELGLVEYQANNGSAGAEHERRLYRWEGNELKLIRSAVSETKMESTFDNGVYMDVYYYDILHMAVRDHTQGDWEGSVVWEKTITMDEDTFSAAYEEEMAALWQGLK